MDAGKGNVANRIADGAERTRTPAEFGELDLASILVILWMKRLWILAGSAASLLLGGLYAFTAKPVYFSKAVIALKESDKGGASSAMLSQLGGLGGMVASQLGFGNTNLAKLEIILNGHDLAEKVIAENDLLPRLFPESWDDKAGKWLDSTKMPGVQDGVKSLKSGILAISVDEKRKFINVGVNSHDPNVAKEIVVFYLAQLNKKLLSDVKNDAETNRDYLEGQLIKTHDPVLQEKISTMIASEIEKFMLVSTQSFEVLETPIVPTERSKPKRKVILALSLAMGFMASVTAVLIWPIFGMIRSGMGRN